jgi:hypothetical protein
MLSSFRLGRLVLLEGHEVVEVACLEHPLIWGLACVLPSAEQTSKLVAHLDLGSVAADRLIR